MSAQAIERSRSDLSKLVEQWKPRLKDLLPRHLEVATFHRKVLFAISKTPALLKCDPMTVVQSITEAASLGLDPTGLLGESYLVPYGSRCQLIVGYRGLITLAHRSGDVTDVWCEPVFDCDEFAFTGGDEPRLTHTPDFDHHHHGEYPHLRGAYAIAELKSGRLHRKYVPRKKIEAIRASSKAVAGGPWSTWPVDMALKTAVRQLCKLIPASTELARALALDETAESGEEMEPRAGLDVIDIQAEPAVTPASGLKARVAEKAARQKVEPKPSPEMEPVADEEDEDARNERLAQEDAERAGV